MASSPYSIFDLAAQNRWTLTAGDRARIFEISVPGPERGGIANRLPGGPAQRAAVSANIISELEKGDTNHWGHIVPCLAHWLVKKNRASRVVQLVNDFVERVAGRDGWEQRFARKFGVIYAALVLGTESGLLRWPEDLPLRAVKKCYRKARQATMTNEEMAVTGLTTLKTALLRPGAVT